jgi:SSS family solute:Na+ symporter
LLLAVGLFAILLASQMQNVLELMLYSYAFMVSGLFVPVIGALFGKKSSNSCFGYAIWRKHHNFTNSHQNKLPLGIKLPEHLDANIYGLTVSLILFLTISYYHNNKKIKQNGIQNN